MQLLLSHELEVPGARHLAPDELRAHMEERFAWALGRGHAVCALACELLGLEGIERREPGITPRVLGALAVALEPAFLAAEAIVQRDERCLVVLVVGPDPIRIEAACRAWIAGAKELRIDGAADRLRLSLRVGYAVTQPGQRLFLDTLLQVAREGLRVARCRAPGACVHTLLYDFLQERFERERGSEGIAVTASAPPAPGAPASAPAVDTKLPEIVAASSRVRSPSSQRCEADGAPADPSRRARELAEALDAQRRENEELRARLQALETGAVPPGDAPTGSARERIDLLERRLAKLQLSLAEAEQHLAQASQAGQEGAVDPGLPSMYRTVQGLAADASQLAAKAALMEKIFAANLELHERLRRRHVA